MFLGSLLGGILWKIAYNIKVFKRHVESNFSCNAFARALLHKSALCNVFRGKSHVGVDIQVLVFLLYF